MPAIERDGLALAYRDEGTGEPLVLLHALTADGRSFGMSGQAERLLSEGFRLIVPDAAGHGGSANPDDAERFGLAARVDDVLAVADAAGLGRFGLLGYSMGGWIASGVLASAPARVAAAVIAGWDVLEGSTRFTAHTQRELRSAEFRGLAQRLIASRSDVCSRPKRIDGYVETYLRLFVERPAIEALAPAAERLMLASGSADPYAPNVRAAAARLGSRCTIVEGDHITAFASPQLAEAVTGWFGAAR